MQHAKAVVVDDQLALVGSANLDLRSLFLNYELMVAFYEPTTFAASPPGSSTSGSRRSATSRASRGSCATCSEGLLLWLAFQL
jgi:cardiolipin synthase